jgi:hypothetical protein
VGILVLRPLSDLKKGEVESLMRREKEVVEMQLRTQRTKECEKPK